jgi:hypothetical protein
MKLESTSLLRSFQQIGRQSENPLSFDQQSASLQDGSKAAVMKLKSETAKTDTT